MSLAIEVIASVWLTASIISPKAASDRDTRPARSRISTSALIPGSGWYFLYRFAGLRTATRLANAEARPPPQRNTVLGEYPAGY